VRIAIDYDGTYTADPGLWRRFIIDAESRGHRVVCVTCRRRDNPIDELLGVVLYYTEMASKQWHMESIGVKVDVWIDDMPETVVDGF